MSHQVQDIPKGYVAAGRYEIVQQLGMGGMGSVYLAYDRNIAKQVAVKFLDSSMTDNTEFVKRFKREACAAAAIRHENICDVSDYGVTEDNVPFIVMEYLKGETLTTVLAREKKLSSHISGEIIVQVLEALGAVHDAGIVHRDLKPDNIFLTYSTRGKIRPKLIDFGIAKFSDATGTKTAFGRVMGTVYYMSPEQAEGAVDKIDQRTDIWSTGVILYEMLTGLLPFVGNTLREVMGGILFKQPKPPDFLEPSVPRQLSVVVEKAMAKAREDRFPDAYSFATSLEQALSMTAGSAAHSNLGSGPYLGLPHSAGANLSSSPEGASFSPSAAPVPPHTAPSTPLVGAQSSQAHPAVPSKSTPSMTSIPGYEVSVPSASDASPRKLLIAAGILLMLLAIFGGFVVVYSVLSSHDDPRTATVTQTVPLSTAEPTETTSQQRTEIPASEDNGEIANPETAESTEPSEAEASPTKTDAHPDQIEVSLRGLPEGAEVTFKGQPVKNYTIQGELGESGPLVVRADGFREHRRDVTLTEGLELNFDGVLQQENRRTSARGPARRRPRPNPALEHSAPSSPALPLPTGRQLNQPATGRGVAGGWEGGGSRRGRRGTVAGGWE